MGPNASNHNEVNRFCKCISVTKQLLDNFDHDCAVLKQSGRHVQKKCSVDLKKLSNNYLNTMFSSVSKAEHINILVVVPLIFFKV